VLFCFCSLCLIALPSVAEKRRNNELTQNGQENDEARDEMMETLTEPFFTDCFMNNYAQLCKFVCFYDALISVALACMKLFPFNWFFFRCQA
jgi:hypothetical protein